MVATPIQDTVQLAIETTGRTGSIALLQGEQILKQVNLDPNLRTAASLAPQVDQILRSCEQKGKTVGLIAIADGPGSFTGLRIGVTTAKTLAYALDLPLVAVDSLAAIAAAAFNEVPDASSFQVSIDAYRGQVFHGEFSRDQLLADIDNIPDDWTAHPDSVKVLSAEDWNQIASAFPDGVCVAGDARCFKQSSCKPVERPCDAIGVGLLAIRALKRGLMTDPLKLVPRYLKLSAAEEKLTARSS